MTITPIQRRNDQTSVTRAQDRADVAPRMQVHEVIDIDALGHPPENDSGPRLLISDGQDEAQITIVAGTSINQNFEALGVNLSVSENRGVEPTRPVDEDMDFDTVKEMEDRATAEAEALVQLVEKLSGQPLTPDNVSAWLEVLENFEPGPFSAFVVKKIGDAAIQKGPVRTRLLEVQETWRSKYGTKQFHAADLDGLATVLNRPTIQTAIMGLLNLVRRLNPFS